MAPSVTETLTKKAANLVINKDDSQPTKWLASSGSLDKFPKFDVTPVIGTEFESPIQLVDLLRAPNADQLIKDLAILVSQRGVVFFRNQEITIDQQKQLGDRLGRLSGKPSTSGLHVHPTTWQGSELGDYISVIDSDKQRRYYQYTKDRSQFANQGWHSDISFEAVPSDYAILKIHKLPKVGGDTLWASGYEAYDRLSPKYKELVEDLTAHHSGEKFQGVAERIGEKIRLNRGAPENTSLVNDHPVVRTNPVTGWRSIYVNRGFVQRINELNKDESDSVLHYLYSQIDLNHDLQVRFKWNKNDIAIWDNRSVFHTATFDYTDSRTGDRVVSLGERPYFDPKSTGRREALGEPDFYRQSAP